MIHRTIAAALLVGLAASARASVQPASQFHSRAYDQVSDLAAGRTTPAAAYDASPAQAVVQTQVSGALATGGLEVPAAQPLVTLTSAHAAALAAPPAPSGADKNESFFNTRGLLYGAGGAAAGAAAGWFLGGPIGALIGAVAGFALGFLMSKILS